LSCIHLFRLQEKYPPGTGHQVLVTKYLAKVWSVSIHNISQTQAINLDSYASGKKGKM
jgi:capsule polysaccharide modification protein KpsS